MLHLANGNSAADAIRRVVPSTDEVLGFPFPLNCGPIRARTAPDTWLDTLDAYWNAVYETDKRRADAARRALERALSADTVALWVGTTSADQLLAALLFDQMLVAGLSPSRLSYVAVSAPTRWAAVSPAVADTEMLQAAFRQMSEATEALSHAYSCAWRAWISDDPTFLAELGSDSSLPQSLGIAMRDLVTRYPDHVSGLGRWDFRSLHHAAERGPRLMLAIGHLLAETFETSTDVIGDGWAYARMRRLGDAKLPHPLLSFDRDSPDMRGRTVSLTSAGKAVLNGEANFARLNGLVDDIGGVALSYPEKPIWVRTGSTLVRSQDERWP